MGPVPGARALVEQPEAERALAPLCLPPALRKRRAGRPVGAAEASEGALRLGWQCGPPGRASSGRTLGAGSQGAGRALGRLQEARGRRWEGREVASSRP